MRKLLISLFLIGTFSPAVMADEALVVIGHNSLQKTDLPTLQRLYTGRAVSLNHQSAIPLNLLPGNPLRAQFLVSILGQNEEQYSGYWLVRRYVGKGTPPQELASEEEIIRTINTTPGAVGYVPLSKVPTGGNIIFKP